MESLLGAERKWLFVKSIIIVTISDADFQLMIDGKIRKVEGVKKRGEDVEISLLPSVLLFDNRFNRTYLRTASTFSTFLFINHIGLTLFNGIRRTFLCACSASYTFFGNDIGHRHHPLYS